MHFHRDVLAIADTFSAHVAAADRATTSSPARRRWRSPSASAAWSSSRCGPAPARCCREGHARRARRTLIARAPASRSASPRRPPTARCSPSARRGGSVDAAAGGVGRRAPRRADLARVPRRHRGQAHRRHRRDRDAAHLHLGRRRRHPARRHRSGRARLRGRRPRRARASRCRTGTPGRLAVKGPTGCRYLADPRQTVYVAERLEHHRRHLRPGRATATSGSRPAATT